MGWLWSASTTSNSETPSPPRSEKPWTLPEETLPSPAPQPSKPLSREEQADLELEEFIRSISSSSKPPSSLSTDSRPSQPLSRATTASTASAAAFHMDALYPSSMSCRQAFDSAFYCQSLGGQFNNVYRHGTLRNCSEHWGDFWFCMRSRGMDAAHREDRVRALYKRKAAKYKTGPSAEDVFGRRTVAVVGAFGAGDAAEAGEEEEDGVVRDGVD